MLAVATISPEHDFSVALAIALFDEIAFLDPDSPVAPDGVYLDCIASLAFGHLLNGLTNATPEDLRAVADSVHNCLWLTHEVRGHLNLTLRKAADGGLSVAVLAQFVKAAADRSAHQMAIDYMRSVGADGLGAIADAITGRAN